MVKVRRHAYTLIEIIITIAITGILSIGMFKAFEAITLRSEKAKILTTLSLDSQSALDQLSLMLYNRAPMSLKGCTNTLDCVLLDEATTNKTILQWYGTASESYLAGTYSGFIDLDNSQTDRATKTLYTPNTFKITFENNQSAKWHRTFNINDLGLIFAGSFENGIANEAYKINSINNNLIQLADTTTIDTIYEKYYLVDTAYAVTRKADVKTLSCPNLPTNINDNTLLLFYDYRPWNNENFCANGKISILSLNVNAFNARLINGTIRLGIDMNATAGKMTANPVRLSKQKVVF